MNATILGQSGPGSNGYDELTPHSLELQIRSIVTECGLWGIHGIMVTIRRNGHGDPSSNSWCISHSANTFGKGINPTIFFPAMIAQSAGAVEYTDCFSAEG